MMETLNTAYRTAVITSRTLGGYRVWVYNCLTEQEDEQYFENKTEARHFAKWWTENEVF